MSERGIPTQRVNETYLEAQEYYEDQVLLERLGRKSRYDLVLESSNIILKLKELSFLASDELSVFLETYEEVSGEVDLSGMDEEYNQILISFEEERFEEVFDLIENGYGLLSEIQSSQATSNIFYDVTTRNLKKIFIENWKLILSILIILLILFFIFHRSITIWYSQRKLRHLQVKKHSVNLLIKNLQNSYFKKKDIPSSEYHVKLKVFKEMLIDIDRQIPLFKKKSSQLSKKSKG
jgi:hypothetical protein